MENRIALISIIIGDGEAVQAVNAALHDYGAYVLGRMGLPIRDRNVNAISVVVDAPLEVTNALTGRLGKISGVAAKALYSKL